QAEDGIRDRNVTGVQTCALPICLRKKGYLARSKHERPARYSPCVPQNEVERGLVREFVEKTLAGSLSPFVAYLADAQDVTDAELDRKSTRLNSSHVSISYAVFCL